MALVDKTCSLMRLLLSVAGMSAEKAHRDLGSHTVVLESRPEAQRTWATRPVADVEIDIARSIRHVDARYIGLLCTLGGRFVTECNRQSSGSPQKKSAQGVFSLNASLPPNAAAYVVPYREPSALQRGPVRAVASLGMPR